MTYVDGFVAPVPNSNREAFVAHARKAAELFKEAGALSIVECWGNDVPDGQQTSFPMAVKKAPDETVVFSWVVWPDKATRDAGMARMMQDSRTDPKTNPMPFDGRRAIFGGFEVVFQA